MITFEQLEALRDIVASGTFTRAAAHLYITQPALSHRIKHLESALGVALVDRHANRKGVALTPAGRMALEFANEIFNDLDALLTDIHGIHGAHGNGTRLTLNVGASAAVTRYMLPAVLARYRQRAPHMRVNVLHMESTFECVAAFVRTGAIELGIAVQPEPDPVVGALPFATCKLISVAPPDHPALLQGEKYLSPFRYPFAVFPKPSHYRGILEDAARSSGVDLDVAIESFNIDILKDAALNGKCLAVLPEYAIIDELQAGLLREIEITDMPDEVILYLLFDSSRDLPPPVRLFVEIAADGAICDLNAH